MAFRRSVTSRAKILYQQQRVAVPFSHIDRDDSGREALLRRRPFAAGDNMGSFSGSRNLFQDRRFAIPAAFAPVFGRNMSTFLGEGAGADKLEVMTDVLGEKAAEVAVAAADSFLPVAALQYVIDYVHTFTGLDWWLSIVLTTLLFRLLQLPFTIHQIKAASKFALLNPQLEKIQEDMYSAVDMDPDAVIEGHRRMKKLFKEHGVTPFSQFKGILIVGPVFCCFFYAIINMAKKVQSFKDGGALWFTDLTTPDALYILPVLVALINLILLECNALEGLEGNRVSKTMKNFARVVPALTIPVTASFPKAVFCYWITSPTCVRLCLDWFLLSSYFHGTSLDEFSAIKKPEVKKMLGIPELPPPPPPSPNAKPPLSFFEVQKKYANARKKHAIAQRQQALLPPPLSIFGLLKKMYTFSQPQQASLQPPVEESSSKTVNRRISPSSVLNQSLRGSRA